MSCTYAIHWSQAGASGEPIERWFATLTKVGKHISMDFAWVERRADGRWWLVLFYPHTQTRDRPKVKQRDIPYRRKDTAQKHLERWAVHNVDVIKRYR